MIDQACEIDEKKSQQEINHSSQPEGPDPGHHLCEITRICPFQDPGNKE
jgi:hypothetical protein